MLQRFWLRIALAASLALAGPLAHAISEGTVDGSTHPSVGAMYLDFEGLGDITGDDLLCSGSYLGPSKDGQHDVFMTAGHCVAYMLQSGFTGAWVSFESDAYNVAPANLIAADAVYVDPNYGHDEGNYYDFGVILLPAGSVSAPALQLPPAGFIDALQKAGAVKDLVVQSVGYGTVPIFNQPHGPTDQYDGLRRYTATKVKGFTKAYVKYSENTNATGAGGTCFGDSGGPQIVVGTSTVISNTFSGDPLCRATESNTRLDTRYARDFYGQFVNLP
jgi:hypothetical protein